MSKNGAASPKILIVEDEFLVRMTLVEALMDEGFDVLEASSGDEAMDLLRAEDRIRLLLTDIQLPGRLSGLDLATRVRRDRPALPIIFMTGRPDAMGRTTSAANDVFIAKPYLPSEVCAAARRLIGAQTG